MTNVPIITINRIRVNFDNSAAQPSGSVAAGNIAVPLRAIFEALGYEVNWIPDPATATVTKNDTQLSFRIFENWFMKRGENRPRSLGGLARLDGNTTVIPLVEPLRALGYTINSIRHSTNTIAYNIDIGRQNQMIVTAGRDIELRSIVGHYYIHRREVVANILQGQSLIATTPFTIEHDDRTGMDFIRVNIPNRPGEIALAPIRDWFTGEDFLHVRPRGRNFGPMMNNVYTDTTLGNYNRRYTMASSGQHMLDNGYDPAFVAGMLGNIGGEGSYGQFERAGDDDFVNLRQTYMRYFIDNRYYREHFSNRYIYRDPDNGGAIYNSLQDIYDMINDSPNTNIFGLGAIQH